MKSMNNVPPRTMMILQYLFVVSQKHIGLEFRKKIFHMIDIQVLFCFRGTWEEIGRVHCEITCLNPSDPVRGKNRAD